MRLCKPELSPECHVGYVRPRTSILAPSTRHTVCLMMQQPACFTDLAREQRLPDLKALSITAEGSCSHSGLTDSAVPRVLTFTAGRSEAGAFPLVWTPTLPVTSLYNTGGPSLNGTPATKRWNKKSNVSVLRHREPLTSFEFGLFRSCIVMFMCRSSKCVCVCV